MMKKRFFALMLLLSLLAVVMPTAASADDLRHLTPLTSSVTTIESGKGYYLSEDVKTGSLTVESTAFLCLNGHKLDLGTGSITIKGENILFTLCDCKGTGSIVSSSSPVIDNQAEFAPEDVTIELHAEQGKAIYNSGTLNLTNTTIRSFGKESYGIMNAEGNIVMYSGEVTGGEGGVILLVGGGTFTLHDGSVSGDANGIESYDGNYGNSVIIHGGSVEATNPDGIAITTTGALTVTGGEITGGKEGIFVADGDTYLKGSPKISGGDADIHVRSGKLHACIAYGDAYEGEPVTVRHDGVENEVAVHDTTNTSLFLPAKDMAFDFRSNWDHLLLSLPANAEQTPVPPQTGDNNQDDLPLSPPANPGQIYDAEQMPVLPQTGDDSHLALFLALLAVSCGGLLALGRKKNNAR